MLPLALSYLFIPSMWCRILTSLGVSLPYRKAFCIQYLSHLGRYIPGRIWAYIAQSYLASQEHVSVAETLCSNAILMSLMHLSSLCIFALSFLAWNVFTLLIRCLLVLISFSLVYFLLRMHWLERGINAVLTRFIGLQTTSEMQRTSLYYVNDRKCFELDNIFNWVSYHANVVLSCRYESEFCYSRNILYILARRILHFLFSWRSRYTRRSTSVSAHFFLPSAIIYRHCTCFTSLADFRRHHGFPPRRSSNNARKSTAKVCAWIISLARRMRTAMVF